MLAVRAFSINAGEVSLIEQRPDGWRPGQDTAGVVVKAAADGSGPSEGTRVVAYPEWEGWAERIPVQVDAVAALPSAVTFEQAATLPVAGLTALRAVRTGAALLGRNVLVTGATGGVGQFAVQLAVASGARVTALVTSREREQEAQELGAHLVRSSLDEDGLGPFHLVLDAVGGPVLTQAIRALAPAAEVVLYGNRAGRTADAFGAMRRREFRGKAVLTVPAG
jgi:NADPH:quinone reductase